MVLFEQSPSWLLISPQLIFHTGRLSALQSTLTASTSALLATTDAPSLKSPVLSNSLRQLQSSPSFHLTPSQLTPPIHIRKAQIIQYPTTRLHLAGQKAVVGMSGGIATGVGLSWAGWVGWLPGSGEGLLGILSMDAGTALGVGGLGALVGVRWAVGRWEKAKKLWWEDWARVGDGLQRDLNVSNVFVALEY